MNLSTLSTEQVHLYLHELEGIFSLLREIVPTYLSSEESTQYTIVMEQAYALEDRVTFEIARRQLMSLQAKLAPEHAPLETVDIQQTPGENEESGSFCPIR